MWRLASQLVSIRESRPKKSNERTVLSPQRSDMATTFTIGNQYIWDGPRALTTLLSAQQGRGRYAKEEATGYISHSLIWSKSVRGCFVGGCHELNLYTGYKWFPLHQSQLNPRLIPSKPRCQLGFSVRLCCLVLLIAIYNPIAYYLSVKGFRRVYRILRIQRIYFTWLRWWTFISLQTIHLQHF